MDKLKKINYPILFILLYLVKLLILPALAYDIGIMSALVLLCIADTVKVIFDRYYDTKLSVISENEFRNQVNQDIAGIKTDMAAVKLTSTGIPGLGKRR